MYVCVYIYIYIHTHISPPEVLKVVEAKAPRTYEKIYREVSGDNIT